jgi:hypothetical protein
MTYDPDVCLYGGKPAVHFPRGHRHPLIRIRPYKRMTNGNDAPACTYCGQPIWRNNAMDHWRAFTYYILEVPW